jgi:hypothetical protein
MPPKGLTQQWDGPEGAKEAKGWGAIPKLTSKGHGEISAGVMPEGRT